MRKELEYAKKITLIAKLYRMNLLSEKEFEKKFLTFPPRFGILLKLSLRDKRKTEKFDLERLDSSKKNLKKVLDKRFWF